MTPLKTACPHCAQRIQYDERYCGMHIKCPGCQGDLQIPPLPPASAAPPPEVAPPPKVVRLAPTTIAHAAAAPTAAAPATPTSPPGIRVVATPQARTTAAAPPPATRPVPTPRPLSTGPVAEDEGPGLSKGKKIALIAALVIIVPAAGYFGFSRLAGMQSKFNEDRAKDDDKGLIGGQVSHIAELNSVLDATDPSKIGRFADSKPVVGPSWTLDVAAAKIPEGDVRGLISGDAFSEDSTILTVGNGGILISFGQGPPPPYERSLSFTTPLKAGENLEGKTWTVAKDAPPGATSVTKQWMPRTGGDRQQKTFKSGFALKVELGKPRDGRIPGKIFVSLPDAEKTVVGGNFVASIRALGAPTGGRPRSMPNAGE